ncbi:immunoglobulin superfamily DCC subclass member 3 [Lampetra fluviatilis]
MAVSDNYLSLWAPAMLLTLLAGPCAPSELAFLEEPQDTVGVRGQPLALSCRAEGVRPIAVSWRRDGVALDLATDGDASSGPTAAPPAASATPATHALLPNGSLYIPSFRRSAGGREGSDEGEYDCTAQNRFGLLLSRRARVLASTLPRFSQHPQPVAVEEGGVARFQCLINARPDPLVTWEKNRTALTEDDDRYTFLPSGVLQITGVRPEDSGYFRCIASNVAGRRRSMDALLTVTPAVPAKSSKDPVILSGPQNLTLTVHQTAILECIATGNPRPIVSWSRLDGRPIGVEGIQVVGTGNLMISDVAVQHAGVYVCAANRPGTRVRRTAQGRLIVQAPPEFMQPPQSVTRSLGASAVLTCSAQGTPSPRIIWLHNGLPLHQSERVRLQNSNSTLTIQRVCSEDEGIYQCTAENSAGYTQASARLAVLGSDGLPGPPWDVRVRAASATTVELAWREPLQNPHGIIGYVLHIRRAQDSEDQEYQEAVSQTTVQRTVLELEPSTHYTFYVKAYSSIGASQPSDYVTAETLGEVPAVPALFTRILNSSAVQLSWEPSVKLGRIRGFKLYHGKIYSTRLQGPLELAANVTSYELAHLESYASYEVRLLAFNEFGDGNFTARLVSLKDSPQAAVLEPTGTDCEGDTWQDGASTTGIVIGIHIGLACIVICVLFLLLGYRRRFFGWPGVSEGRAGRQHSNGAALGGGGGGVAGRVRARQPAPAAGTERKGPQQHQSTLLLAEPRELECLVSEPDISDLVNGTLTNVDNGVLMDGVCVDFDSSSVPRGNPLDQQQKAQNIPQESHSIVHRNQESSEELNADLTSQCDTQPTAITRVDSAASVEIVSYVSDLQEVSNESKEESNSDISTDEAQETSILSSGVATNSSADSSPKPFCKLLENGCGKAAATEISVALR